MIGTANLEIITISGPAYYLHSVLHQIIKNFCQNQFFSIVLVFTISKNQKSKVDKSIRLTVLIITCYFRPIPLFCVKWEFLFPNENELQEFFRNQNSVHRIQMSQPFVISPSGSLLRKVSVRSAIPHPLRSRKILWNVLSAAHHRMSATYLPEK